MLSFMKSSDTLFSKWWNRLQLPLAASVLPFSSSEPQQSHHYLGCWLLEIFRVWDGILLWLVCTSPTTHYSACLLPCLWVLCVSFSPGNDGTFAQYIHIGLYVLSSQELVSMLAAHLSMLVQPSLFGCVRFLFCSWFDSNYLFYYINVSVFPLCNLRSSSLNGVFLHYVLKFDIWGPS